MSLVTMKGEELGSSHPRRKKKVKCAVAAYLRFHNTSSRRKDKKCPVTLPKKLKCADLKDTRLFTDDNQHPGLQRILNGTV